MRPESLRLLTCASVLVLVATACTGNILAAEEETPASTITAPVSTSATGHSSPTSEANASTSTTPSVPPTMSTLEGAPGGALLWAEEFDGLELDADKWGFESPLLGAGDASVHIYQPEAVSTADGLLRIAATRLADPLLVDDDNDGVTDRELRWRSGFITSRDRFDVGYGRVEARLRAPAGQGLWAAIWLRPSDRAYGWWPRSGEIDLVEVLGHDVDTLHTTAHWWNDGHRLDAVPADASSTRDAEGFHVVALEWSPNALVWSVDGVVVHELTGWPTELGDPPAPFDQAFYLNVNLAVGGGWPGDPDATTPDGARFEVDWIRVYALDEIAG